MYPILSSVSKIIRRFLGGNQKKCTFFTIVKLFYTIVSKNLTIRPKTEVKDGCSGWFLGSISEKTVYVAFWHGIQTIASLPLHRDSAVCAFNVSLTFPPHPIRLIRIHFLAEYQTIVKNGLKMRSLLFVVWQFYSNFAVWTKLEINRYNQKQWARKRIH